MVGGSRARWRGRAPGKEGRSARADERGGRGCRIAATGVLAEKFCSQVGRREIVTQFKAGLRLKKKTKNSTERAARPDLHDRPNASLL